MSRKEYFKEYHKKHYQGQKEYYLARDRERRRIFRQIATECKNVPCMDCGRTYPFFVMEFDHRNPNEKIHNISDLKWFSSEKKLREEIAKCDVVCANCHRIRHSAGMEQKLADDDGSYDLRYTRKENSGNGEV